MTVTYAVCDSDGCNLARQLEVESPEGRRSKFVCQDCAGEMQALFGWRILRVV